MRKKPKSKFAKLKMKVFVCSRPECDTKVMSQFISGGKCHCGYDLKIVEDLS